MHVLTLFAPVLGTSSKTASLPSSKRSTSCLLSPLFHLLLPPRPQCPLLHYPLLRFAAEFLWPIGLGSGHEDLAA